MACLKRFQKSSISAVTTPSQTLTAGGFVDFATNRVLTGTSISHTAGSNTVELINAGLYLVEFNGTFEGTTAATITVALLNNGTDVPGTISQVELAASEPTTLSFATLINVLPSCCATNNVAELQVGCDTSVSLTNANITVVKLA